MNIKPTKSKGPAAKPGTILLNMARRFRRAFI